MCAVALFDIFRRSAALAAASSTLAPAPELASPFAESTLTKIVWSDVYGSAPAIITREEALAIPAVFKARAVLLALLADKPLEAYRYVAGVPTPLKTQPAWCRRTGGAVSPWHRMAWTLDDLIFYGWCLWVVRRDTGGRIVDAERVPKSAWKFDDDGRVLVKRPGSQEFAGVDAAEVVLIPGPSEGLLAYAARTITGASEIEGAWVERAKNPVPMIDLHQTVESNLKPEEAKAVVDDWNAARRNNGGAAFTPYDIEARALGQYSADLYVEGRNASRLDAANFFNLPASLLDGSVSTASLTYSTQEGDTNEVAMYAVPYWTGPITGRLSQDDVSPAGTFVRMNLGGLVTVAQSPIGEPGNE